MTRDSDRHDPRHKTDYLSLQHIERYRFACAHLDRGMRVLDVACGTGYGTMALHNCGCDVIGMDIDTEQIEANRRVWGYSQFEYGDVLNLPYPKDSFDAVVSFETLEHVVDGERFFSEIKRVLRNNGLLICSTPNIRYTSHPPFHLREYTPGEFWSLVEQHCGNAERFAQYFRAVDRLNDLVRWTGSKILANLGAKNVVKAAIQKVGERFTNTTQKSKPRGDTGGTAITRSHPYSVSPYAGDRLLRIMLVVTRPNAIL